MSNCVSFHTQLASIMEVLANAAVAEICKLVDDGYAVLRLEVSESRKENKALKRKLQMMELRIAREGGERGGARDSSVNNRCDRTKVCDTSQQTARDEGHFQAGERVVGKQMDMGLRRDEDANHTATDEDATPANPVVMWDEPVNMEERRTESLPVKEERLEEDSDPQLGLKFTGQRVVDSDTDRGKRAPTVDTQTRSAQHSEELNEQHRTRHSVWEVSGLENVLKAEPDNNSVNKRLQHRGSEHRAGRLSSLDSECVTYEKTSHLGTCFSQEDGETERDDPSCFYNTETDSEGMSAHSEPQPVPNTEEGSGSSVSSLSSLDWKTDIVIIDSVPIKEEAEMAWNMRHETLSEVGHPPLSYYSNQRERGEMQTENITHTHPTQAQMRERLKTSASNIIAPHIRESAPCDTGFIASEYNDPLLFRTGSREKRFFCSFCGKGFSCPKKVEIHQRVHTGEKPFSCAQCRKQFAQAGNLKRHQRVHTGEKPFSCTQCEKRFSHLHQLKMHQKVHTGERPYGCPHCGKRFAEKSYLRIHQQRNHAALCSVR